MYIKRTIEKSIKEINKFFPVILVTGARQVGKTTVLQNCEKKKRTYVYFKYIKKKTEFLLLLQMFYECYGDISQ